MFRRRLPITLVPLLSLLAQSPGGYQADVVVIVDTSTSMQNPGMDPERASLLVTKLFSDIVPGRLAVVRLLDLVQDADRIPGERSGEKTPCEDDPSKMCTVTRIPPSSFLKVRREHAGAEIRPERGTPAFTAFKKLLDTHLEQRANNSMFGVAFLAAQGVFDVNKPALPRFVIWLSDGDVTDNNVAQTEIELKALKNAGVDVRAIVFGKGKTEFAAKEGLNPSRASNPAQLVEAFTDAFRGIVQAPYKVHSTLTAQPRFEIKRWIEEAWVIVYGDASLGVVEIETPKGVVPANFAQDQWSSAGAYKVAYLRSPAPGSYKVRATGGGANVTYGVVQRSSVQPYLLSPSEAVSGIPVKLVAGLRAIANGPEIPESEFGEKVQMMVNAAGQTITLSDDGVNSDDKAGDGRYSAMITLRDPGDIPVDLRAKNSFLDRTATASINVSGHFRCRRCEDSINFGFLKAGSAMVCRPLKLDAEHVGVVPLELRLRSALPPGYSLSLLSESERSQLGGAPLRISTNQPLQICLATTRQAASSQASGEPKATLAVAGRSERESEVELGLRWNVSALSFWERWGWLIISLLIAAFVTWVIYGFIKPFRFAKELAVSFAPEYSDLDDQAPQPIKQWRDVKIGFYRNARAYFRADFRITGQKTGAIALLEAGRSRSAIAIPTGGYSLYRETSDGDWELVPHAGRRAQNGDVYRVGDQGPHFRIAARLVR